MSSYKYFWISKAITRSLVSDILLLYKLRDIEYDMIFNFMALLVVHEKTQFFFKRKTWSVSYENDFQIIEKKLLEKE